MREQAESSGSASEFLKADGGKTKSNSIEIPAISLPTGGGAIKGIDEKFTVNAVNGTAGLTLPLPFSKARGVTPALNISYNSGSGNSIFGLGWSLDLSSIKRKTDQELPKYFDATDSDTYLFSEAEDLVACYRKDDVGSFMTDDEGNYVVHETNSEDNLYRIRFYQPRIEGLFARIERWTEKLTGIIKWRVMTKDNITTLFGWTNQSRIVDPQDITRIFEWKPEFVFDDKGNCSHYIYKEEDQDGFDDSLLHNRNRKKNEKIVYTNLYLSKVLYGNRTPYKSFGDLYPAETNYFFETIFDFGEYDSEAPHILSGVWGFRNDSFSIYKPGFEIRTTRLCKRVLLFHHFAELPGGSALVKSLDFEYSTAEGACFTYLNSITQTGYIKKPDGTYSRKSLPPAEFSYQNIAWSKEVKTISSEDLAGAPVGIGDPQYLFTDLYNEGLSGILSEQTGSWYYKRNWGNGKFGFSELISSKPSFSGLGNKLQLVDLDADGGKQLSNLSQEPKGFFELNDAEEWLGFQSFERLPTINTNDSNARMLDLNGDGKPDVLIAGDDVFTWYESDGRRGFSNIHQTINQPNEELGPRIVFAEEKQTIFLADMSGDGLTDLVRIRNGEVCYWPNLGYGIFGSKISMDQAPWFDHPDTYNPAYLRLADIDGSGTTDIIYLGKNKFSCWMNLSGNKFSEVPFEIEAFPEINQKSTILVTDLFGNGVACLVWSDSLHKNAHSPLRYIDLMCSRKPHILNFYKNNSGKEVSLEYTPSTKFYIDDKLAGNPWVTKLHFPVQCLSAVETTDRISGCRFVSSYKYHHGYYDHAEREFRGFGMVEQTDTEHFEHYIKGNSGNITDKELHQAPVITKSWFHTGAFIRNEIIHDQFAGEYWYKEREKHGYPVVNPEAPVYSGKISVSAGLDEELISKLNIQEWREALRACKSQPIRTEIFAKDAPADGATDDQIKLELTPFSVDSHRCLIELLQPQGKNKHAIFSVKKSESIKYHYERDPEDPRITHELNTRFDEYGNVLESASVVYPRFKTDHDLPSETQQQQGKPIICYSTNQFTNDVKDKDIYRLRVPSEVKTFELKGVGKTGTYYSINDFDNILNTSDEVLYHETDSIHVIGHSQRRLTEHIRNLYYRNDLTGPLPLHELESSGIKYENYQLALTPELLADVYGTINLPDSKIKDELLIDGKFAHSEGDLNWWIRSGTTQFIESGESKAEAQNRFYSPVSYTDPFGSKTKVKYFSNYYLFIEETENNIGNKEKVDLFNFRMLLPQRLRDANNNLTEIINDESGFVKAKAILGKGDEADQITGISEYSDTEEIEHTTTFFDSTDSDDLIVAANSLLKAATERYVYDAFAYKNFGKPIVVATIRREEHFKMNSGSPVQIGFEYTNGFGKPVMKKVQAEPGLAKQVIINTDDGTYTVTEINTAGGTIKELRWIGTGRTVLNNKGNAVKQYEPYFSVTPHYENVKELIETGVTPILYYDAIGRLIKTENPDGTFSKTLFETWKQINYDTSDTVLESSWHFNRTNRHIDAALIAEGKDPIREKAAADKAAKHANTPSIRHFDNSGRQVLSIDHNKNTETEANEYSLSRLTIDIEGNVLAITDARGNLAMQYKYDMLGNRLFQNSMDAGKRWLLNDVSGNPLASWDERNHEFRHHYDLLHRPLFSRVTGGDGTVQLNNVFDRTIYGESLLDLDRSNESDLQSINILGRPIKHYDTGGGLFTLEYNFKGEPFQSTRKLFKDYKSVPDWTDENLDKDLEFNEFTVKIETDAIGRIVNQTAPDGSVTHSLYNRTGLLNKITVNHLNPVIAIEYIRDIEYNEKGQRERIRYGNDVIGRLFYDKETFRLIRSESKRQNGDLLQDWRYTFDSSGNITHIEDRNIPVLFFDNQRVPGVSEYTYDALYRLKEATGRENNVASNFGNKDNWNDAPYLLQMNPLDPMAVRNYQQKYQFDKAGNMTTMQHIANGGSWTRNFEYEEANNRLKSIRTGQGVNSFDYAYDYHPNHGFITAMPHLEAIGWNFKEELVKTISQRRLDGGTPETTWYQYDGQGERIRKITENQADAGLEPSRKEERIYLAGYETYRTYHLGSVHFERESLSLTDEGHRFALIETVKQNAGASPEPSEQVGSRLTRYQLANHIGSASLELDGSAQSRVISYEEYHPFGTTAYQAKNASIKSASKRYRYTGMERDEETGLNYHRARYYITWAGRWMSSDPAGCEKGFNLYIYASDNPINRSDTNGKDDTKPPVVDPVPPPVPPAAPPPPVGPVAQAAPPAPVVPAAPPAGSSLATPLNIITHPVYHVGRFFGGWSEGARRWNLEHQNPEHPDLVFQRWQMDTLLFQATMGFAPESTSSTALTAIGGGASAAFRQSGQLGELSAWGSRFFESNTAILLGIGIPLAVGGIATGVGLGAGSDEWRPLAYVDKGFGVIGGIVGGIPVTDWMSLSFGAGDPVAPEAGRQRIGLGTSLDLRIYNTSGFRANLAISATTEWLTANPEGPRPGMSADPNSPSFDMGTRSEFNFRGGGVLSFTWKGPGQQ